MCRCIGSAASPSLYSALISSRRFQCESRRFDPTSTSYVETYCDAAARARAMAWLASAGTRREKRCASRASAHCLRVHCSPSARRSASVVSGKFSRTMKASLLAKRSSCTCAAGLQALRISSNGWIGPRSRSTCRPRSRAISTKCPSTDSKTSSSRSKSASRVCWSRARCAAANCSKSPSSGRHSRAAPDFRKSYLVKSCTMTRSSHNLTAVDSTAVKLCEDLVMVQLFTRYDLRKSRAARLWRPQDGDFEQFAAAHLARDQQMRDALFERLELVFESVDGHFVEIARDLGRLVDLYLGHLQSFDE